MGRTRMLLETGRLVEESGHELVFVMTRRAESFYAADENEFEAFSRDKGIAFIESKGLFEARDRIMALQADVVLSVNWPNLVSKEEIDMFPLGILNAHAGDLPRYRGNACPNWAILNFENQIGLTIHRMTAELDAGPYIRKSFFPIDTETYITDVYEWLDNEIPRLFLEALGAIETEEFVEQRNDVAPLRTFPRLAKDSRINWGDSSRDVLALIRSSSRPFPGASCFLNGGTHTLRIFRASAFKPKYEFFAVPGTLCEIYEGNPVVSTGFGLIVIEDYAFDGLTQSESKTAIFSSMRNRLT